MLDDKDHKIISLLRDRADYSTRQIAKHTALPITTVHNRINKLRKAGIIKKFTIDLDFSKLEKNFVAYVLLSVDLPMLKAKKRTQYDLAAEVRKFYFVERVDIVSGGSDLVAIIRVKDVEEFDRCLLTKLQMVEGVEKTQSLIVIHRKD